MGFISSALHFETRGYKEYNQFLSQAGRPAEAQLGKSGRSNLAPRCWASCLEWPASRLFRNHKFRRIKLDAKFFRFGMEHFNYPAM
ncbi:hypothetical protein T11_6098 [Trichinella zimbabwensis]|uniref:Uncharacterized protein n=1 Tax=Trichinella zimbabwensis TaxID=268475 RepID=A0A0V1GGS7_9BILA|nr:hypothetical protein T11_6098 [Trichinella zimbabwensis]